MAGLVVKTMLGLGDNLWSRPHVLTLAKIYSPLTLVTPWPQVYEDFARRYDIQFARASTRLRTQAENIRRWRGRWVSASSPAFHLSYSSLRSPRHTGLFELLEASLKPWLRNGTQTMPEWIEMDVPQEWLDLAGDWVEEWTEGSGQPVVLVKVPTLRREWFNPARNCNQAAIQQVVDRLKRDHTVVGIASLHLKEEWLVDPPLQGLHTSLLHGEVSLEALVGLTAMCRTVGAVGFMLPLAIAVGGQHLSLFGGNYGKNSPKRLIHPRYPQNGLRIVEPDHPCVGCTDVKHNCNTEVSVVRLEWEVEEWLAQEGER